MSYLSSLLGKNCMSIIFQCLGKTNYVIKRIWRVRLISSNSSYKINAFTIRIMGDQRWIRWIIELTGYHDVAKYMTTPRKSNWRPLFFFFTNTLVKHCYFSRKPWKAEWWTLRQSDKIFITCFSLSLYVKKTFWEVLRISF